MADSYEKIANGEVKQCPKCGLYKELLYFEDGDLKTKVSRICCDCKKKKRRSPVHTADIKLATASETKQCPQCGSKMFLRNGRYGKFYGCSRYPMCKGTRNFVRK
jgi:DNA-directed RNA polymerase subunit RPC12/RpoP